MDLENDEKQQKIRWKYKKRRMELKENAEGTILGGLVVATMAGGK